jgi:hypothetical protein
VIFWRRYEGVIRAQKMDGSTSFVLGAGERRRERERGSNTILMRMLIRWNRELNARPTQREAVVSAHKY